MRSDKFGSQLDLKSKTWIFTYLDCMFPESNGAKFHHQNSGILAKGVTP